MDFPSAYAIALSAGVFFGLHDAMIRVGGSERGAGFTTLLSLASGYPVILLFAAVLGGFSLVSFKAFIFYVLAGVLNFSVGRVSVYVAINRVGAGIASILVATSIVHGVILGVVMGEPLSRFHVIGSMLILLSVVLASSRNSGGGSLDFMGIAAGLLGGFSIAASIALGRIGNLESGNPIAGVFIAYTSGLLSEVVIEGFRGHVSLEGLNRRYFLSISAAGMLAAMGQVARYVALMYLGPQIVTPAQNVRPIVSSVGSSTLSKYTGEHLSLKVILSAFLALVGAAVIYWG